MDGSAGEWVRGTRARWHALLRRGEHVVRARVRGGGVCVRLHVRVCVSVCLETGGQLDTSRPYVRREKIANT